MKKKAIKIIEAFLVLFATAVMAATIFRTQDANILGPMAGAFLAVFSAYLGIDMAKMLKETTQRAPGEFKPMHTGRYVLSTAIFLGMYLFTFIIGQRTGSPMTAALAVFGTGSLLMIGFIIGGLGGNKLLTGKKE